MKWVSMLNRIVLGAFFTGAVLFLGLVICIGLALAGNASVRIPMVLEMSGGYEDGVPSLYFTPKIAGILIVSAIIFIAYFLRAQATRLVFKRN